MGKWFTYLKPGLSPKLPQNPLSGRECPSGIKANLKNLRPFISRHWQKGMVGVLVIFLTSLLSFPQPLITRYIVDNVILGRQLSLLTGAILLLIGISLTEKLGSLVQQFYLARFEQEVITDIQGDLLDRALRFPKAVFDANQTGQLMSRLGSDVQGLRWFFSGTIVQIISDLLRFIGGVGFLIYLEWKLAMGVLVIL